MILKNFHAENFRNVEKCDISFSRGVNLLYGNNAQGKTNAVEGIYLFSRGKSFRARDDGELVSFGKEGFNISISYESKNGEESLEYSLFGKERRRKKNGYRLKSVKEMVGSFKAVLFSPDDLSLVKDSPEKRRSFLNVAASQCYEPYLGFYYNYKKALDNRNRLLKDISKGFYVDDKELLSWSEYLATYAAYICSFRKDYVARTEKYAREIMKEISDGKEEISLSYKTDAEGNDKKELEEEYARLLTKNLGKETAAGITLYGPHHDDLEIYINGSLARSFGSQGQQRSIVLALKLSEGEINREMGGEYPVFLFDDVLSELDEARRSYVLSGNGEKQIIISSCEKDEEMLFADRMIEVNNGRYEIKK